MDRYFFYNTNIPRDLRNVDFLLRERCAITSGGANYGEQLASLEVGDTLLMYENETGFIGVGTVVETWDGNQASPTPYYPNRAPGLDEYRITVDWDRELTLQLMDNPISLDELRQEFKSPKYTPRGVHSAVLKIDKHNAAAARLVKELRTHRRSAPTSEIGRDIQETTSRSDIGATTKATQIESRIGQGKFRDDVLKRWQGRCAVTGSTTRGAIRASHIKPWSKSTDEERLDPHNGIPLIATLDALFDAGQISFDATGMMLVADTLSDEERHILGVSRPCRIKPVSAETAMYLQLHRTTHGFAK